MPHCISKFDTRDMWCIIKLPNVTRNFSVRLILLGEWGGGEEYFFFLN